MIEKMVERPVNLRNAGEETDLDCYRKMLLGVNLTMI
jgi:hypothetical protein